MKDDRFDAEMYYDDHLADFKRLADEVEFAIEGAVPASVKLHGSSVRVKDRSSYLGKILRKGYTDPLSEVQDLVGARVVCLYASDLPRIRELIATLFEIVEEEDKVNSGPVDTFGYMSMHYICRLQRTSTGPRYEGLHGLTFEVQCRTILMDAWANVSHHLAYKGEASIPKPLKRDFHALAGLFYIADSHFEMLAGGAKSADDAAANFLEGNAAATDVSTTKIDRSTMQAYLGQLMAERNAINPMEVESISELVEEFASVGIVTLAQLISALEPALPQALRYERKNPPATRSEDGPPLFSPIGLARISLAIANPQYVSTKYPEEASVFAELRARMTSTA